jgi:hypothetical protein
MSLTIPTVDMAVPYNDTPDQDSEFASMRDSFYILMNLNQYKMKPVISMTREAEGLLRIALFSRDLKLVGTHKTLSQKRLKLAHDLRSNRRKGVVPIFLSTLWFIVALGISIEAGKRARILSTSFPLSTSQLSVIWAATSKHTI